MSLEPLRKKPKPKAFAVFDIETTTDLKRVYLVGYHDGRNYRYWESEPLAPDNRTSALSQFLEWFLATPRRPVLYSHNGGNFDSVFALSSILGNWKGLKIEIIPSQSSILLMKVTDGGKHSWQFLDSARLLPDSLDNLAKCFLNKEKMKEGIDYETLHQNPRRYDYLKTDCVLLFEVLSEYFKLLRERIGGVSGISAASTSLNTYRASYQKRSLPEITPKAAALARAGYYGGRCEPFRRRFLGGAGERETAKTLHCYDVNSMYPWAMKQPQPVEQIRGIRGYQPELAGFVDAEVTVSDCLLPILPCRSSGKLLFPIGTFRGTFSTRELRLAEAHGQCHINRVHASTYFVTDRIFDSYVDTLYRFRQKKNPDGTANPTWTLPLDRVAKISLNSLYGKFGSQEVRESIHIRPTLEEVLAKGLEPMASTIVPDCFIERTTRNADYMLPQIAAWITALARCRLAEALLAVGTEAFYCDTDSIFTTAEVPNVGPNLGQWKDEYAEDPIIEAYFLAPKVYVLKHASGKLTNKAKGFSRFGEKLPPDIITRLANREAVTVSRFAKVRSVIRGDFGLIFATKQCRFEYEKREFLPDGSSRPRKVECSGLDLR